MDANLLDQINNFGQEKEKKESIKGIEVDHPMKQKIRDLYTPKRDLMSCPQR